jgi:hypothetical protein
MHIATLQVKFCDEDSAPVGCDAVLSEEWFLLFNRIVVPSSSGFK